ncbi:MAG: L,D-transpeptidase [Xanthobacteraceae bacterium]|nr:L,D-transpeptidase [Xanthobacteraceae bacterium]
MRSLLIPVAALMLVAAPAAALAKVSITVDKDNQIMTVAVDGVQRYQWPVSTGNPSHETPDGSFRTFRMEEDHYSKEFDDAPMPHAIFFTKQGHAIHGTFSEKSLGVPVSHGCVRLSRAHAATLYDLVKRDGLLTTTVTLTGSSRVALARGKGKPTTAVARRDPAAGDVEAGYDADGNPIDLRPQLRRPPPRPALPPQQITRDDDGYIYPADGSSSDQRYPSPRPYRRTYQGQVYSDQYGQQYAAPRGYATPDYYGSQQGYYVQPRTYLRPRGLFSDMD